MKIELKSITHAMKAKSILEDNNIKCSVEKISKSFSEDGCVYSIVFDDKYKSESLSLLENNFIEKKGGGVISSDLSR